MKNMQNDPVTVGESVPDREIEFKRGSGRLPESSPLKIFRRIRRYLFVSALLAGSISLLTSCGNGSDTSDHTIPEERAPAGDQGDQAEVDLPLSAENMKELVRRDYQAVFDQIHAVEDPNERMRLLFGFYAELAATDLDRALELLPDQMNEDEQDAIGVLMVTKLVKAGRLDETLAFIKERFPGEVRVNATDSAIQPLFQLQGMTVERAIAFWSEIEPGAPRNQAASTFAGKLSQRDPLSAVTWFESLEPDDRQSAMGSVASLGDPGIVQAQLAMATMPELRSALADRLGTTLAQVSLDEARVAVRNLENDQEIRAAETSLIFATSGVQWSKGPDFDDEAASEKMVDYLKDPITEEGKIQATSTLAQIRFDGNPESALDTLRDSELSDSKTLQTCNYLISQWLEIDGIQASTYVGDLPPGEFRTAALTSMISFLKKTGDTESAEKWAAELESGK